MAKSIKSLISAKSSKTLRILDRARNHGNSTKPSRFSKPQRFLDAVHLSDLIHWVKPQGYDVVPPYPDFMPKFITDCIFPVTSEIVSPAGQH